MSPMCLTYLSGQGSFILIGTPTRASTTSQRNSGTNSHELGPPIITIEELMASSTRRESDAINGDGTSEEDKKKHASSSENNSSNLTISTTDTDGDKAKIEFIQATATAGMSSGTLNQPGIHAPCSSSSNATRCSKGPTHLSLFQRWTSSITMPKLYRYPADQITVVYHRDDGTGVVNHITSRTRKKDKAQSKRPASVRQTDHELKLSEAGPITIENNNTVPVAEVNTLEINSEETKPITVVPSATSLINRRLPITQLLLQKSSETCGDSSTAKTEVIADYDDNENQLPEDVHLNEIGFGDDGEEDFAISAEESENRGKRKVSTKDTSLALFEPDHKHGSYGSQLSTSTTSFPHEQGGEVPSMLENVNPEDVNWPVDLSTANQEIGDDDTTVTGTNEYQLYELVQGDPFDLDCQAMPVVLAPILPEDVPEILSLMQAEGIDLSNDPSAGNVEMEEGAITNTQYQVVRVPNATGHDVGCQAIPDVSTRGTQVHLVVAPSFCTECTQTVRNEHAQDVDLLNDYSMASGEIGDAAPDNNELQMIELDNALGVSCQNKPELATQETAMHMLAPSSSTQTFLSQISEETQTTGVCCTLTSTETQTYRPCYTSGTQTDEDITRRGGNGNCSCQAGVKIENKADLSQNQGEVNNDEQGSCFGSDWGDMRRYMATTADAKDELDSSAVVSELPGGGNGEVPGCSKTCRLEMTSISNNIFLEGSDDALDPFAVIRQFDGNVSENSLLTNELEVLLREVKEQISDISMSEDDRPFGEIGGMESWLELPRSNLDFPTSQELPANPEVEDLQIPGMDLFPQEDEDLYLLDETNSDDEEMMAMIRLNLLPDANAPAPNVDEPSDASA